MKDFKKLREEALRQQQRQVEIFKEGDAVMSASKMREAAKNKNMLLFYQGIPDTLSQKDKLNLMLDVRKGMGLK